MAFTAVILAAGKGTRMASPKPKALQTLAGKPLIVHLLDTLTQTGISDVVIIHSSKADEEFKKEIKSDQNITYVEQERALGTAVSYTHLTLPTILLV